MERAVKLLSEVFHADIAMILQMSADDRTLTLRATFGLDEHIIDGPTLATEGASLSSYTVQQQQPVTIADLPHETRFRPSPILLERGITSGLSVVIRGRTRPYGVFSMFWIRARRFALEESSMLAAAANVMGMAIERANTEAQLRASESRSRFLASVVEQAEALSYSIAHDLRAPLRAISGYAKILEEELAPILPPHAQNYLERMGNNAVRLGTLIDALLSLQRLSRQPLSRTRTRLNEAVDDALVWLHGEQPGRDIEFVVADLGEADVDPALMRLAFANLLSNAIKFTRGRQPARVTVGSAERDGEQIYFVQDNGAGFDMRFADKLFGVFQRLHPEAEYEGNGIGLASVSRIITRHGGRIWADAAVDRGATFYFTIGSATE